MLREEMCFEPLFVLGFEHSTQENGLRRGRGFFQADQAGQE